MSISESVFEKEIEIRYKGIYDLEGIYKTIRGWLDSNRYDYMEKIHKDKQTNPWGNEVEWEMVPCRKVDGFIMFYIYIRTKFYDVKEFSSVVHGHKRNVTDGRFWIEITGVVEYDYGGNFSSEFGKKLLNLIIKKIFKKYFRIYYHERLKADIYKLHNEIKEFMKLETAYNAY
ncbi:MAG: hypothetical protein WC758_03850 [Candidatus Woesearchaeota archaeon]|jgi:hypothetical protein